MRHECRTDRRHWGQEQEQELEGVRSSRQDLRTVVCAEFPAAAAEMGRMGAGLPAQAL